MAACATAEQALHDAQPRILRNAAVLAVMIHALALAVMPGLRVKPYELNEKSPPPIEPMNIVFENPRPVREVKKPESVPEFEPVDSADADETIGPTAFDPVDTSYPVFADRAPVDGFLAFDDPPVLVRRVEPLYPDLARQAELEGTVGVMIVVNERGDVERAEVVGSIPGLDEAALAAVLQWKFEPARQRNVPVRVRIFQPIRFRLRG
ncbi:MAG: TonB family protein [Candidatus Eisenbacteria bacterium]|nr:TonB family protein [Candidatus Eisenbacteria bacterium]